MKQIGQGWQYTVYDLGNGRVLKKFHSWLRSYLVILKDIFPFKNDSLSDIPGFIRDMKSKLDNSLRILRRTDIPQQWFANPHFISPYDFEQDKVVPLHEAFRTADSTRQKAIIDQFMHFNVRLLEHGIIDKSFNITKNYGLDKKGEIALIDIGELYDDPVKIAEQIRNRIWRKDYIAGCIGDPDTRAYFIEQMEKHFHSSSTKENL